MSIDLEDINGCFRNPTKFRILSMLRKNGPMTARQMMDEATDIPQTTLYRTLSWLNGRGILVVTSENKVRAMTERTYYFSDDMLNFNVDTIRNNDLEGFRRAFGAFVMELASEFDDYCSREDSNLVRDHPRFISVNVYATDEELREIEDAIMRTVMHHTGRRSEDQTMRTMTMITGPPARGCGVKE